MKSFDIENIKNFTTQLFAGKTFDGFLAIEAAFTTACSFTIDGHLNAEFIGEEESHLPANKEGIAYWERLRPICYEIIKGKKVPRQFSIVFMLPFTRLDEFCTITGIQAAANEISGLFLNINFKQGRLYCTTGCSLKTFSLDRKIETAWDEYMAQFLKQF